MMPSSSFSGQVAGPTGGLVEQLAAYLPRLTLPDPVATPVSLTGAILYLQIEGFEALVESLMKTGREGGDVLTRVLNSYYSPLINAVEQYGGDILTFDGDSLVVFFKEGADARLAGRVLLDTTQTFPPIQTVEGRYTTRARAGVGLGKLTVITLGSDIAGRSLVFGGEALELARQLAQSASWQQVVGGEEAETVSQKLSSAFDRPAFGDEEPLSVFNRLSPFLPRQLAQRLKTRAGSWPGEFRRVVNIFVQLPGMDLSRPADVTALQKYYQQVQQVCAGLDGRIHTVLPIPTAELVCLHLTFGALLSNNDDAEHALRTALTLRDLPTPSGQLPTIGIASGNVFIGSAGNDRRQNYIVLGKVVNLSSQFAEAARQGDGPGTLLVDRFTRERVGLTFLFGEDLVLNLAGWPMPVKASRLLASRPATQTLTAFLREYPAQPQPLNDTGLMVDEALHGHRQITLLRENGAAAALAQRWLKQGGQGAVGHCVPNATNVPYLAWSGLLAGLVGLNEQDSRTEKAAKLSQVVARYAPSHVPFTGWLSQLVGLAQEEPGFRQRISGPQQAQFAAMVLELLGGMAEARPTLLVFHDLQWSDEAGLALLEEAVRNLGQSALLFCLTAPTADSATDRRLLALLSQAT